MKNKKFSKGLRGMLIVFIAVVVMIVLILVINNYSKEVSKKRVYFYSDGIKIAGVLYEKKSDSILNEGIVFVPSPKASQSSLLYKLMSKRLAEKEYIVLTINLRGYGKSEEPKKLETASDLNFTKDIENAVSFLAERKNLKKIHIISHSFATLFAVSEGINDVRVSKLIALSPPLQPYISERYLAENMTKEREKKEVEGFMKYSHLGQEVPLSLIQELIKENNVENYIGKNSAKPFLIANGELETDEQLTNTKNFVNNAPSVKLITWKGVGHFYGFEAEPSGSFYLFINDRVIDLKKSGIVIQDTRVTNKFIDDINIWLKK